MPAGWSYYGCISESYYGRLLGGFAFSSPSLTPLLCMTECQKRGFTISGMEFGDEVSLGKAHHAEFVLMSVLLRQ